MAEVTIPRYLWLDGELHPWETAMVHVSLLGHATVSGVFEGIRGYAHPRTGELYLFRLREHMQRLLDSMRLVRMKTPHSVDELCRGLVQLVRANEYRSDVSALVLAYLDGLSWSFASPELQRPTRVIMRCRPTGSKLPEPEGIACCVSSWTRISDTDLPPRIKCVSNYHNSRMAAMQAQADGYDQPILLNSRGKVAEAPGACVFIVRRGVVHTPAITSEILESITRASLIELLREVLRIQVEEREIDRTELYVADEVFLCGTAWEVTPVTSVDRYTIGNGQVGEVTQQIAGLYHDIVRGIDSRYSQWRTPVWA